MLLLLDRMARRYGCRPSALVAGDLNAAEAWAVDELACAEGTRAEGEAVKALKMVFPTLPVGQGF